jgi:hypothetical protein
VLRKIFGRASAPPKIEDRSRFTTDLANFLIIGKAKTGTSLISKAIQYSLPDCVYCLEPKTVDGFLPVEVPPETKNNVIKIIYEHFETKPNLRRAIVTDELPIRFRRKVLITRDPRDELISRLLYIVRPLKDMKRLTDAKLNEWLDLIRVKEKKPADLPFFEMVNALNRIFDLDFLEPFSRHLEDFSQFYHDKPDDVFEVKYEDFVVGNYQALEEYLGFALVKELPQDNLINRTFRSGSSAAWKEFMVAEDLDQLRSLVGKHTELLGYTDWELRTTDHLDENIYSRYVQRLATTV